MFFDRASDFNQPLGFLEHGCSDHHGEHQKMRGVLVFCRYRKTSGPTARELTLAYKRVWGLLLNGRTPTKGECKAHTEDYRLAVKENFWMALLPGIWKKSCCLGTHLTSFTFLPASFERPD